MLGTQDPGLAALGGGVLAPIPDVRDLILGAARRNPDHEAVVSLHQSPLRLSGLDQIHGQSNLRWKYRQLEQGASHLANQLAAAGIRKGSPIAFFSENRAEWVLLCCSSIILGCPFVPLNPRLASNVEELRYMLAQISPGVIVVVGEEIKALLQANADEQLKVTQLLITLEDLDETSTEHDSLWVSLANFWSCTPHKRSKPNGAIFEDATIIGFTSGTTSLPKACPQSSCNLMVGAIAMRDSRKLGPTDSFCQHVPGFAAMTVVASLAFLISGATIIYPSPSFSASATLDAIEKERCTYTLAAPAVVKALAMHPTITQRSLETLRIVDLGGAPIYPEMLELVTSKQGLNCEKVGCGWGMTESPAPLLAELWDRSMPLPTDFIALGKPSSGTFAKICPPGSREPTKCGQEGELHVGGPQVVRGYLNGDNGAFYDDNGIHWIKTGDMARIENGKIYIIGRYKDVIIRGGQNISPAKIERTFQKVSGVEVGPPIEFVNKRGLLTSSRVKLWVYQMMWRERYP
jgi:acyl-CoA synthetase (AMP-forming)/AMP-acid ligase II